MNRRDAFVRARTALTPGIAAAMLLLLFLHRESSNYNNLVLISCVRTVRSAGAFPTRAAGESRWRQGLLELCCFCCFSRRESSNYSNLVLISCVRTHAVGGAAIPPARRAAPPYSEYARRKTACRGDEIRRLAERTPTCALRCFRAAVHRGSAGCRTRCGTTAGRGPHRRCHARG